MIFQKITLEKIQKMKGTLFLKNDDYNPPKSDFQILRRAGRREGFIGFVLLIGNCKDMSESHPLWRNIFSGLMIAFAFFALFRAYQFSQACDFLEEQSPLYIDDVLKKKL